MTITQPLTITRQMSAIPEVSFVGNQTFLRSSRPLIQTFLGPHLTTMKIRFIAINIQNVPSTKRGGEKKILL